jgi:hypothetical protein
VTAWASTLIGIFLGFFGNELRVFITDTKTHWWPALLMIPLFFAMGPHDAKISAIVFGTILGCAHMIVGTRSLKLFHAGGRLLSNDDVLRTLRSTVNLAKLRSNAASVFVTTAIRSESRYPLGVNRNSGRGGSGIRPCREPNGGGSPTIKTFVKSPLMARPCSFSNRRLLYHTLSRDRCWAGNGYRMVAWLTMFRCCRSSWAT